MIWELTIKTTYDSAKEIFAQLISEYIVWIDGAVLTQDKLMAKNMHHAFHKNSWLELYWYFILPKSSNSILNLFFTYLHNSLIPELMPLISAFIAYWCQSRILLHVSAHNTSQLRKQTAAKANKCEADWNND
jgi:hypothetical protein